MTELKMTIPTGIMWIFIGSILFQGASGLALVWQRHESDMACWRKSAGSESRTMSFARSC